MFVLLIVGIGDEMSVNVSNIWGEDPQGLHGNGWGDLPHAQNDDVGNMQDLILTKLGVQVPYAYPQLWVTRCFM